MPFFKCPPKNVNFWGRDLKSYIQIISKICLWHSHCVTGCDVGESLGRDHLGELYEFYYHDHVYLVLLVTNFFKTIFYPITSC